MSPNSFILFFSPVRAWCQSRLGDEGRAALGVMVGEEQLDTAQQCAHSLGSHPGHPGLIPQCGQQGRGILQVRPS